MTEDDTFLALKKATFETLRTALHDLKIGLIAEGVGRDDWEDRFENTTRVHGWSLSEFRSAVIFRAFKKQLQK